MFLTLMKLALALCTHKDWKESDLVSVLFLKNIFLRSLNAVIHSRQDSTTNGMNALFLEG